MNESHQTIAANYIAMFKGDKEACLRNVFIFDTKHMSEESKEIRAEILRQLFAK